MVKHLDIKQVVGNTVQGIMFHWMISGKIGNKRPVVSTEALRLAKEAVERKKQLEFNFA